ncbi:MAG TPA: MFS transporter, partial [Ktedonobacteraceae bacterium]|nr:MFS transporter [Ktedonobacteraceae bacterium]
ARKRKSFAINRNFRLLWLGHTISRFGSRATSLSFVAILVLNANPLQIGWLEAMGALPSLLISLLAGVWIDRTRRKPVLIIADVGRAILLLTVPLAAILGTLSMLQLYVITAFVATLTVFFEIASQAFLPVLLQPDDLLTGNSKLETSSEMAEIIGPALGGPLIQAITAPMTICLDALSFIASAVCIVNIQTDEQIPEQAATQGQLLPMLSEGIQVLYRHRLLRATIIYSLLWNFCGGAFAALYSLYIMKTSGFSPAILGLLIAAGGVGGFVGAMSAKKVVTRVGMRKTLMLSTLLIGTMALLTPLASGPAVVTSGVLIAGQLIGDVGIAIYQINEVSLRQRIVPAHLLGRANASVQFLIGGIGPLGAIIAGAMGNALGARTVLFIGASGMLLACMCLLLLLAGYEG